MTSSVKCTTFKKLVKIRSADRDSLIVAVFERLDCSADDFEGIDDRVLWFKSGIYVYDVVELAKNTLLRLYYLGNLCRSLLSLWFTKRFINRVLILVLELGSLSHAPSSHSLFPCQTQRRALERVRPVGQLFQQELCSLSTRLKMRRACLQSVMSVSSPFDHSSCSI